MRRELKPVPPNRFPVINKAGDVVGNVGPKATAATAARFLGHQGATLKDYGGRKCWIEQGTNSRHSPRPVFESKNHKAARGSVKPRSPQ